jgi:hypothetical protein
MPEQITDEDLDLLSELGVESAPAKSSRRTAREQRIIAGFEEIERFVAEHGRLPEYGEDRDIFERLYAVRLDQIRESSECRGVLKGMDTRGLLNQAASEDTDTGEGTLSDEELLEFLGARAGSGDDVTTLVHVRSREEIEAAGLGDPRRTQAEEIARRTPCKDFEQFKPVFEQVQRELESGERQTVRYKENAEIKQSDLFILEGQKALVAELGEQLVKDYQRPDRRLRVIFDNGTESALWLRSLQRALYKDKTSRRIVVPELGPLFSDAEEEDDLASGYIYVLRSRSDHPYVAAHREVVHKIGVTGGDVAIRVAGAKKDPTYLLADVDIIATFKLANINRTRLEALLHRFFGSARLDLELTDRFGLQVKSREWFLVPLPEIDKAIQLLKDGELPNYRYEPTAARVVPV